MFYKELCTRRASLVTQLVNNPPAMWETWVDPWVGKIPWRRKWQPSPVFLPGESSWIEEPRITKSRTQLSDYTHSKLYWKLGLKIKYILYYSYHRFPM